MRHFRGHTRVSWQVRFPIIHSITSIRSRRTCPQHRSSSVVAEAGGALWGAWYIQFQTCPYCTDTSTLMMHIHQHAPQFTMTKIARLQVAILRSSAAIAVGGSSTTVCNVCGSAAVHCPSQLLYLVTQCPQGLTYIRATCEIVRRWPHIARSSRRRPPCTRTQTYSCAVGRSPRYASSDSAY